MDDDKPELKVIDGGGEKKEDSRDQQVAKLIEHLSQLPDRVRSEFSLLFISAEIFLVLDTASVEQKYRLKFLLQDLKKIYRQGSEKIDELIIRLPRGC